MSRAYAPPSATAAASQPPDAAARSDPAVSLSQRLSCDRCRVQKLKCSVSSGSGACERCTRAKVPCVFGRRNPSRRTPSTSKAQWPAPPISPTTSATDGAGGFSTTTTATDSNTNTNTNTSISTTTTTTQLPPPPLVPEPCASDAIVTWDSLTLGLGLHDMIGYGSLPCMDAVNMYGVSVGPDHHQQDSSSSASWSKEPTTPTAEVAWPTSSADSCIKFNSVVLAGQRLTALVLETQQLMRTLEEGPWHTDNACSLDDYPIGTILELAQQFSAIAGPILSAYVDAGGMMPCGETHEDRKASGAVADTPNILLIMCGYLWLVRIYHAVMGHFQKHLNCVPPSHQNVGTLSPMTTTSMPAAGSTLRLGELPCVDVTLGLQQIQTAVCMMLDALHEVEGHLGCGATVARDMAIALLLNSGWRQDCSSSSSLGLRVTVVKELLREKMRL